MSVIPPRKSILALRLISIVLCISWLVLFCIKPVVFYPDSETYQATAAHLTDSASIRPILFPLLLRITAALHLKLSVVCFLIDVLSLVCFLRFCAPRSKSSGRARPGILIAFLLLPAIWSYCGTCLTESILPAVEIWITILMLRLFFSDGNTSVASAIGLSVLIALLAILLKPWIMLYVLGCSALILMLGWCTRLFRSVIASALILFLVSAGAFVFSYRYNISKSPSSANIGFLIVSSGKVEDLKARWKDEKDTASEKARFISSLIDDINLINTKYNSDPYDAPVKDLKVLKVTERSYVDTVNKAFRVAYLERGQDIVGLMRLSVHKYIKDIHLGLDCLDKLYGPSLPLLPKAGVYCVILLAALVLIFRVVRWRSGNAPSWDDPSAIPAIPDIRKKQLVFVGILLFCSFFFALFLCIAGGVELPRTVLPAVLFQLLAVAYLIQL